MKPWQAAAVVTGVVVATQVLLRVVGSPSGADEERSPLAPSTSEFALNVAAFVFVFGVCWLLFSVLRARRDRRDGER